MELLVRGWAGGGGERRNEFAGGEVFKGLEAAGEFFGGEAAVAIESAEKIGSGARAFFRIAMHTAGNEVAVGIAPGLDLRHDMVNALNARVHAAQAIKAEAAFARVDGLAQRFGAQEVRFFQIEVGNLWSGFASFGRFGTGEGDLFRQTDFDDVAGFAALDEAENAVVHEATHRGTHRAGAKASSAGEPVHRELELELAFEARVAEEIEIDDLVGGGEMESRDENVGELFPDEYGVGDFGVYG